MNVWPMVRIGDLAHWRGGLTPSMGNSDFWTDGDIPWISSKEVVGGVLKDTERKVTRQAIEGTSLRLVPAGSVAVVVRSGILLHTFPVALVPFEATVNQDVKIGTPMDGVLPVYLAFCLQANGEQILQRFRKTGTTVQSVDVPGLLGFEVPLPSVHEQRRIVDLIGALDQHIVALICERQSVEVLLGCLRESLVAEAEWTPVSTMTGRGGIQIGPFGSQLHARDYTATGVPVVMPQDLARGQILTQKIKYVSETTAAMLARHRLRPGDLVLPRRGDLKKRALVTSEQDGWLCGTGCIRIRLSDPTRAASLIEGLSTAKTDEWLEVNAVGTTMLNLNTEIVSKLPAPEFSEAGRAVAAACLAAHVTVRGLRVESQQLIVARGIILQSVMTGAVSLPETYDTLLAEAV